MIIPAFLAPAPLRVCAARAPDSNSRNRVVCSVRRHSEMGDNMPSAPARVLKAMTKRVMVEKEEEIERMKARVAERSKRTPTYRKMQKRHLQGPAAFRQAADADAEAEARHAHQVKVQSAYGRRRRTAREGVPLREVAVGAKFRGVVQNLVKHGAYVDVGAVRDGLVHVRDMSADFVRAPEDLVRSGDKVDVWVKYVNPVTNVLGLSMVNPRLGFKDRISISDIKIGARYEGFVERVTNYGAYVDIGAERLGFLHVAAIWGRRPRETLNFMRLGQPIWVHVDDVNEVRSHIKLRARGRGHKSLEKDGPLGTLANPSDVVKVDEPVVKSQVLRQRAMARPGEEEEFMEAERERLAKEEEEDNEIGFDELGDDYTSPSVLALDDISHMFDDNTKFSGLDINDVKQ